MKSDKLRKLYNDLLILREKLSNHLQMNENYGLKESLNDSIGELSSYDNHPADIGTEVFERGKDLALREESILQISLINKALQRVEEGTYGKCERCDTLIPEERLEAVPETSLCVKCHQYIDRHKQSRSRPIEEEFMSPGFGKYDYDESSRETEFDSEDSWQAVAKYGTSNDASMYGGELNYNEMYTNSDEGETHYHYEYPNQYVDHKETDYDEVSDIEIEDELKEMGTIEQQAYQDYLRNNYTE